MKDIVVIKCGGSTLSSLQSSFYKSVKDLLGLGKKPVIVHGGGPEIKKLLTELQIPSEFINGLRKTTKEVMEVVEMVLAGKVNKYVVSQLQLQEVPALGLSGVDGNLLRAEAKDFATLGYVGDVADVNKELIYHLIEAGYVPVIAPIGADEQGQHYNINADSAAGAVARQLAAESLLFVTDVPGILKDGELIPELNVEEVKKLIADGTIYGGMIPKVEAALHTLEGNLKEVMIVDGENSNMVQNGKIIGTTITNR